MPAPPTTHPSLCTFAIPSVLMTAVHMEKGKQDTVDMTYVMIGSTAPPVQLHSSVESACIHLLLHCFHK